MRCHSPENRHEYSSWEKLRDVIKETCPLRVKVENRDIRELEEELELDP